VTDSRFDTKSAGDVASAGDARSASDATSAGDTMLGPHVLVADVSAPELTDDDEHHLTRVLRLRAGDSFTVGDGAGSWRQCRLGRLGAGSTAQLEPVGEVISVSAPSPELTVGFAVLKGGRSETVVQKLTELGIDRIMPFVAARSVVRWDEAKAQQMLYRWQRVAVESVMQCRRLWLPQVTPLKHFSELDLRLAALADPAGGSVLSDQNFVLVGPEGGWSPEEFAAVNQRVCLGVQTMRAETAAIAAGALLAARRSGHLPLT